MNKPNYWAISPLEGRYYAEVDELRPLLSEAALFSYRLQVECRWLLFLSGQALPGGWCLAEHEIASIHTLLEGAPTPQLIEAIKTIEQRIKHDVKACEYYLAEHLRRAGASTQTIAMIHFACTSEDINNLSYGLMLREATQRVLLPTIKEVLLSLGRHAKTYAHLPLLARTHGQAASPTTLGKEFAVFGHRLLRQYEELARHNFCGKINGAVGNFNAHYAAFPEVDWLTLSQNFVEGELGLEWNKWTTQIEDHDGLARYADSLRLYNTIALGLAQDCWQYISQGYLQQRVASNEVGSSTMPHKINPIAFENAEGQFGLSSSLAQFFSGKLPISRLQRDLSDSTTLRSVASMLAHHLLAQKSLLRGLAALSANPEALARDLDGAWEVLGEALQTILRRYGQSDAYELLKSQTRGHKVDQALLGKICEESAVLPAALKEQLLAMKPQEYVGVAGRLAEDFATLLAARFPAND